MTATLTLPAVHVAAMDDTHRSVVIPLHRTAQTPADAYAAHQKALADFLAVTRRDTAEDRASRQPAMVIERRLSNITATAQRSAGSWATSPNVTQAQLAHKALRDEVTLLQEALRTMHAELCAGLDIQEANARDFCQAKKLGYDDDEFMAAWEDEDPKAAQQYRGGRQLAGRVSA